MANEAFRRSLEGLPETSKIFVKELVSESIYLAQEATTIIEALRSPDTIPGKIDGQLRELQTFAVTPETTKNPSVQRGWRVLGKFVEDNETLLNEEKGMVFVYGSVRYQDPVRLDYDVVVATNQESEQLNTLTPELNEELLSRWKRIKPEIQEGDFNYISIEGIADHCERINENDTDYLQNRIVYIESDFALAAPILSGHPIFTSPDANLEATRQEIRQYERRTPILGATICSELDYALIARKERRGIDTK